MKTVEFISTKLLISLSCPHCNADNYIADDLGDGSDLLDPSTMDVEGVKCHKCGKESILPGTEDYYPGENLDEISMNIVDGSPEASIIME